MQYAARTTCGHHLDVWSSLGKGVSLGHKYSLLGYLILKKKEYMYRSYRRLDDICEVSDHYHLIQLGWIHTLPDMDSFLSYVDPTLTLGLAVSTQTF